MQSNAKTVDAYVVELDEMRKGIVSKLSRTMLDNLPQGFHEEMCHGMIG